MRKFREILSRFRRLLQMWNQFDIYLCTNILYVFTNTFHKYGFPSWRMNWRNSVNEIFNLIEAIHWMRWYVYLRGGIELKSRVRSEAKDSMNFDKQLFIYSWNGYLLICFSNYFCETFQLDFFRFLVKTKKRWNL